MPLQTQNDLPSLLRDSKLPWKPRFEDQAPAPRPGDAWTAPLGELLFILEPSDPDVDGLLGLETPPGFSLALHEHGRERLSWALPDLQTAHHVSEALADLLVEQLQTTVRRALTLQKAQP